MVTNPPTLPTVVVTGGPSDGASLTLDAPSAERVVGSGPHAHMRLPLGNVDGVHARLLWDERGVVLADEGSTCGTYVNGEKVEGERVLRDGDRVFLGPPGSKESAKLMVLIPPLTFASSPAAPAAEAPPDREPAPTVALVAVPTVAPAAPPTVAPAAAPSPRPEVRKPAPRPGYTDEMPSIAPERVRGPLEVPPIAPQPAHAAKPRRAKKSFVTPIPRAAVFGGLAAAAAVAAFFIYKALHAPLPVLTGITPPKAEPGQTVTVSGSGFERTPARNRARFGEQAGEVTAASETRLSVSVPPMAATAAGVDVPVRIETRGARSNALFLKVYAAPGIATVDPEVALPGDEVRLTGKSLAGPSMRVLVGGIPAEVSASDATSICFRVPQMPVVQGKSVPLVVQIGAESGRKSLILGRLPMITEVAPPGGQAGDRVTLKGRGFDASPGASTVTFSGQRTLVLSASPTELTVAAPAPPTPESQIVAELVVEAGGKTSMPAAFTLRRPSASAFAPRYFAAPVLEHAAHDHAFVSTDLGPVLLLTGKADAPSTAERAARVAESLNALAGAGRAVTLEARDKPATGVGVNGSPDLLITTTAEDAAGYEEPWDPSMKIKGRKATPRAVATYWAALLQDYLSLFVQGSRPTRLLELSPRRVLLDIYGDASRRVGPGGGVPVSAVLPPTTSQAKTLRELALLLPAEGQGTAAAAVEGKWEGSMEETGVGSRAIQVRLKLQGGRLTGSLTTTAGGLAMDVPLRDIAYEKGVLKFVLAAGSSPRRFEGALRGDSIAGTLLPATGKDPLGTFTLRFAE